MGAHRTEANRLPRAAGLFFYPPNPFSAAIVARLHCPPTPSQVRNSAAVFARYEAYKNAVGNEQRRFHGTSMAPGCSFGIDVTQPPCTDPACAVCRREAVGPLPRCLCRHPTPLAPMSQHLRLLI